MPVYDERGFHLFPILEIDTAVGAVQGLYNTEAKSYYPGEESAPRYTCPADIPLALEAELKRLAVAAFEAIGALDVARVDLRLGRDGKPYLMEINTIPGLNPTYSDIVLIARAEGMEYVTLVNEILNLALYRYGLQPYQRMAEGGIGPCSTKGQSGFWRGVKISNNVFV